MGEENECTDEVNARAVQGVVARYDSGDAGVGVEIGDMDNKALGLRDAKGAAPAGTRKDEELELLIASANRIKTCAYAPYSKFRVGAALLAESGKTYCGANVENCSYGLTICAERNAMFQAVTSGERKFRTIVITTDVLGSFTFPCGACRQVLAEFGDMNVYCVQPDGKRTHKMLSELLPFSFDSSQLDENNGDSNTAVTNTDNDAGNTTTSSDPSSIE